MRSSDNLPHMGLTFTNLEPEMPLFLFRNFECSVAELMAGRNKVAQRRKGKGGGADEVTFHFFLVI